MTVSPIFQQRSRLEINPQIAASTENVTEISNGLIFGVLLFVMFLVISGYFYDAVF